MFSYLISLLGVYIQILGTRGSRLFRLYCKKNKGIIYENAYRSGLTARLNCLLSHKIKITFVFFRQGYCREHPGRRYRVESSRLEGQLRQGGEHRPERRRRGSISQVILLLHFLTEH